MTGPVPAHTQELILTYARRGWYVSRIAAALSMTWPGVRNCIDAWGVPRRKRRVTHRFDAASEAQ